MGRDRVPPVPAPAAYIGARVKRGDDPRLLTGRGRYVDDLTLPRMVHVAFVRSAHAHARLARVAVDAARRAPGVVGVLTGDDVARLCKPYRGVLLHYEGMKTGAMLPLAVGRVRYVGEPIVALAAESRAAAEDAAALVDVECEPLPPVLTPAAALAPDAPLIHPELGDNLLYETRLAAGDPTAPSPPPIASGRAVHDRTAHRRAARAAWPRRRLRAGDARAHGVDLHPGAAHDAGGARRALRPPEHRLRVIAPDVGGSFGIKIHVYQDDMAAVRDGADAGPSREVRRRPARVLPVRHPRPRADHPRSRWRRTATAS